jgi:hypothetical protein
MSRDIVENVFGREMTREIWTGNYDKVLPISVQDFDLSAVLPAVFYMFRYGQRRGRGKFTDVFVENQGSLKEQRRSATIARVAQHLSTAVDFKGFQGEVEQAILGDLLLCFCLENTKHALGRTEQVQRVAPAHYMASWVDLPNRVAWLRYVPEMIVAMLTNQQGDSIQQTQDGDRTWFTVGRGFENNVLLQAFCAGMGIKEGIKGALADRKSDRFDEKVPVGIDQLLMIRLAQQLGEAPDKMRGGERISNQRPIAEQAAHYFSEDIRRFVRCYAGIIPRQTFVVMMESCIAIGLTTILTGVIEVMLWWAENGGIPARGDQMPVPFFVDGSNGMDLRLRALAEQSFDDYLRRVQRFPVVLMAARLLDWGARYNRRLKTYAKATAPYAREWLDLLGNVLNDRHDESRSILYDYEQKTAVLADKLRDDQPEIAGILEDVRGYPNPIWRLAEALTQLQGRANTHTNLLKCMESSLLTNSPNGLASKRRVQRSDTGGSKKAWDIRSLVFTDSVLDYLTHLQLLKSGNNGGTRPLAFKEFLRKIRHRYGFYIDEAPPGMMISNDLLQANRSFLERRLRDLGLLSGVNDAEAMKRLTPRFILPEEECYDVK